MSDHQASGLGMDRLLQAKFRRPVAPALAELMFLFVVLAVANQKVRAGGQFGERALWGRKRLVVCRKD